VVDNPWEEKKVIWKHLENVGAWNHFSVFGCQKLPRRQCLVAVYCNDLEAKFWQTFHMQKCLVKIVWTAL
jgi:hypothetical protein